MSVTATSETPVRTPRRAAIASWIGSALEYYDFAVYGTATALIFNILFFPKDAPPAVNVILAMGTMGVAYVVRPLGALIMGPLADKFGRRFVLMLTLFLMGGATFSIGLLPTFSQAGVLAPALLVLCRIIQGLSASGEQASSISMSLEHASEKHRGFVTSWTLQGTQFGTLLATLIFIPFAAHLTPATLATNGWAWTWGWRIPFWASAIVVVAAYIIRRKLQEPPSFAEVKENEAQLSPLAQTLRFHWKAVLRVAACALINTVNLVFTVWSVSFATNAATYGLSKSTILWVPVLANVVAMGAIPLAGMIADRVGRKPVFIVGVLGPAVVMYPYLWSITTGNMPLVFLFGILMSGLLYSASNAIWPAFYAEMFPTRTRATGLALGTQIGFAISGGFAPVIATAAAGPEMRNWLGPAIFVSIACLISAGAAMTAKETAFTPLDGVDDEHVTRDEIKALDLGFERQDGPELPDDAASPAAP